MTENQEQFCSLIPSLLTRMEFENTVLSISDEFLPKIALKVKCGQLLTILEYNAYYGWLITQLEPMQEVNVNN